MSEDRSSHVTSRNESDSDKAVGSANDRAVGSASDSAVDADVTFLEFDPLEPHVRASYHLAPAPWVAGASDIGRRHETNQDYLAMVVPDIQSRAAVLVVSDGVSSAANSERASERAALTVRDEVARVVAADGLDPDTSDDVFARVYRHANGAVLADGSAGHSVGSCTLITAVVIGADVFVANLGDTRAYWIADDGGQEQLSIDDSIAQAQIDLGMDREEAESGIHAHAITKWLGAQANDVVPRTTHMVVDRPGWLLVCSDGLWNYASLPAEVGSVLRQIWASMPPGDGPLVLAQTLIGWANQQGGRDNITVAVARLGQAPAA